MQRRATRTQSGAAGLLAVALATLGAIQEAGASGQPAARIKAPPGFRVELVYSVPQAKQGSWVNMTIDPKGRLIVSDQFGKLYRVTPPALGRPFEEILVEPIDVEIGEAQGLVWAFDSLYVVVNKGQRYESGLYRVRDLNGDDKLDTVETLRKLNGGAEHGPHGIALAPDGKSLYLVAGNNTQLTQIAGSLVPRVWGEDNLLPRMVDGAGFMTTEKAPGGCIYRVSPSGDSWELVSMGYRNPYDVAFNRDGELFTYDSDMEWDVNMPWYRPTRVLHVVSGSDFGYRNGSGKWPPYTIDSLPPVVDVGQGSPTGVVFGYGSKFPVKYQEALYICDWSYGKLYAVHLQPKGSTYVGMLEEFVTGTPLALTDVIVNPNDGAMYFTVGGRMTESGLYRVTYSGAEPTAASQPKPAPSSLEARALRHWLEAFHGHPDRPAVADAWPYFNHPDRFIRWAARVAIEFQDPTNWRDHALAEKSAPEATFNALLALIHVSVQDPAHRAKDAPPPDPALRDEILKALDQVAWNSLDQAQRLDLLRVYQVLLNRFGRPDEAAVSRLIARFNPDYPARSRPLNAELCRLLVYLQAPDAAAKTIALLERSPTQEEQIEYLAALRVLKAGWTAELRQTYFTRLGKANRYKGGNSLRGFIANIQRDALASLNESERSELKTVMESAGAVPTATASAVPERPFVKTWTLEELVPLVNAGTTGRDAERGRALFAATKCYACHRFNEEGGGLGPDLSGVAGRFSARDLLESVIVPSKTISDQYEAVTIATHDGKVITGRIVNLHGETIHVSPDMLDPNRLAHVKRGDIEEIRKSPVSVMPEGLLNTLDKEEILDLMAYLLSRGEGRPESAGTGGELSEVFFNAKDLEGRESLPGYWSVQDGVIVGRAPAEGLTFNTFLCSKKKYKDIELSFQVRIKDGNGNSGLQFRSRIADPTKFAVAGPQADMGQRYWGSLYSERDPARMLKASPPELVKRVVKPDDFNNFSVRCVGKHVTIKVNGETTVDGDFLELPDEGIIAWQLHAGFKAMEVTFRNIRFRALNP